MAATIEIFYPTSNTKVINSNGETRISTPLSEEHFRKLHIFAKLFTEGTGVSHDAGSILIQAIEAYDPFGN